MSKITDKIKEKAGVVDSLSKFKKFTKLRAYIEYDHRVEIKTNMAKLKKGGT